MATDEVRPYDSLAIGFGPAGLATAVAIADRNARVPEDNRWRTAFIEAHDSFLWHPNVLIEGSRMQISFLKDLATMRDPSSGYTFLSYLHEHERMASFINCSTSTPTRREYADYLAWAATKVASKPENGVSVFYSEYVESIEPVEDEHGVSLLKVVSKKGSQRTERLARNLLISSGGQANVPEVLQGLRRVGRSDVIHSSEYLARIESIKSDIIDRPACCRTKPILQEALERVPKHLRPPTPPSSTVSESSTPCESGPRPPRVAVIGAGQSAAEIFLNLQTQLPMGSEVDLIIRHGALRPSDDSGFSNETFDPANTDLVYSLGSATGEQPHSARIGLGGAAEQRLGRDASPAPGGRQRVLEESKATNYAVVNPNTLDAIYDAMYAQRVDDDLAASQRKSGTPPPAHARLTILPYREIVSAKRTDSDCMFLSLKHSLHNETRAHCYNAIVCATGYDRQNGRRMLARGLEQVLGETEVMEADISRNYRLELPGKTKDGKVFKPRVWLQGSQEASHGISDSLLSVVGIRAGEVVGSLEAEGNF